MEVAREGDIRVPLISAIFCLFVIAGGVFLILYVYYPEQSQNWYPFAALVLIGSPWIFWFMTYIYTCIKACVRNSSSGNRLEDRQISKRSAPRAVSTNSAMNRTKSKDNDDGRHVHFGEVVVMQDDPNLGQNEGENRGESSSSSVASKESEMPLTLSVSS